MNHKTVLKSVPGPFDNRFGHLHRLLCDSLFGMGHEDPVVGTDDFKTDLLLNHRLLEIGLLLPEAGLGDTGVRLKLVKERLPEGDGCPEVAEGIGIV